MEPSLILIPTAVISIVAALLVIDAYEQGERRAMLYQCQVTSGRECEIVPVHARPVVPEAKD